MTLGGGGMDGGVLGGGGGLEPPTPPSGAELLSRTLDPREQQSKEQSHMAHKWQSRLDAGQKKR